MSEAQFTPKPPYVPFGTFKNFIESFRDAGLPDVIDRSLMRSLSGTVQSMLATSLRSMGFVGGDGTPTERFRQYISGPVNGQREAITAGLKECYSAIFQHATPMNKMTQGQFDKALKDEYGFTASTLDKAASFFLAASAEAGIEVGPHLQKRKAIATRKRREKSDRQDSSALSAVRPGSNESRVETEVSGKPLPYQLLDLLKEPDFANEHKQAVWQLVQYLMERDKKDLRDE